MNIGIIGGGISGLTTAYFLNKKGYNCTVLEKQSKVGGCISTEKIDGRIFENGPNSLLLTSQHINFINELGLGEELLQALDTNKDRFVLKGGKYQILPSGPHNFFTNHFFSFSAKLKIITEFFRRNKPTEKIESLYDFFLRRFNKEICDYALDPFVSGIYAGDPKKLVIKAAFPALYEAEKDYGSIIKGMINQRKNSKAEGASTERRKAYSFKNGLSVFTNKIAEQVDVKTSQEVKSISKIESGFEVVTSTETFQFDKVVIASNAIGTANFLKEMLPDVAQKLENIPAPPMCVVHSIYKKSDAQNAPQGFGGLNPKVENVFTSGSIWTSSIFPNRTNSDEILITTFVGGMQNIEKTELSEKEVLASVHDELSNTIEVSGEPVFQKYYKWNRAIPQYTEEVLELWDSLENNPIEGLFISANWKGGISVPNCIDQAIELTKSFEELKK
ncbi:protoporphyrinogen oxidase [Flammeovirga sp. SubArs3]|uniref:protoporphyrinogen oxidase n=1 Tax=Flammeovirga sp. SubArs3 TaxID=2995316 RepID=UPI00248BB3E6|nr:protoporphyrinogen oxidase [Flammeovirga sp. SubArs3]